MRNNSSLIGSKMFELEKETSQITEIKMDEYFSPSFRDEISLTQMSLQVDQIFLEKIDPIAPYPEEMEVATASYETRTSELTAPFDTRMS